jgi:hypothetical protein
VAERVASLKMLWPLNCGTSTLVGRHVATGSGESYFSTVRHVGQKQACKYFFKAADFKTGISVEVPVALILSPSSIGNDSRAMFKNAQNDTYTPLVNVHTFLKHVANV